MRGGGWQEMEVGRGGGGAGLRDRARVLERGRKTAVIRNIEVVTKGGRGGAPASKEIERSLRNVLLSCG